MKRVPLVLFGFGGVGQSVARLLEENDGYSREGIRLTLDSVFDRGGGVLVRDSSVAALIEAKYDKGTVTALAGGTRVALGEAISEGRGGILIDCSITVAQTGEPGLSVARQALGSGLPVVFASKGPLVAAFSELSRLAHDHRTRMLASAAVGIPLPSLEVGLQGIRGSRLHRIRGILNTSANKVLADRAGGRSLDEAIERARRAGTLEEDPRLDLEGWDAAYKLLILARTLWGPDLELGAIQTSGVAIVNEAQLAEARARTHRIRLVATGRRLDSGEITMRVGPEELAPGDPLYSLGPGEKGLVFETGTLGRIAITAADSGPETTAACVIKDVLNLAAPRGM